MVQVLSEPFTKCENAPAAYHKRNSKVVKSFLRVMSPPSLAVIQQLPSKDKRQKQSKENKNKLTYIAKKFSISLNSACLKSKGDSKRIKFSTENVTLLLNEDNLGALLQQGAEFGIAKLRRRISFTQVRRFKMKSLIFLTKFSRMQNQ